jgi:adenine-specific DNA-methyltransferase
MTNEGDWVFDPFLGTGTSIITAIRHRRRGAGAETFPKYIKITRERIKREMAGTLRTRPVNRPVYDPKKAGNKLTITPWTTRQATAQLTLWRDKAEFKDAKADENL